MFFFKYPDRPLRPTISVQEEQAPNESDEAQPSIGNGSSQPNESSSQNNTPKKTEENGHENGENHVANQLGNSVNHDQPGPSGLQSNQNNNANSTDENGEHSNGMVAVAASAAAAAAGVAANADESPESLRRNDRETVRQQLIIVQQRGCQAYE